MEELILHPVFVPFVFNFGGVVLARDFHCFIFMLLNEGAKIGKLVRWRNKTFCGK
jgi:hypothetical protein